MYHSWPKVILNASSGNTRKNESSGIWLACARIAARFASVYALTYLATNVGAPEWIGLTGILIGNLLKLVTIPLAGWISDRVGRRPVFLAGALGAVVLIYPFFFLLDMALGGGWPVALDPTGGTSDLYVDWVRVYT